MRVDQRLLAYGVVIGSTAIALQLSLWLEYLISRTIGAFFYIAIIVSSWYGGFYPGIATVILSTLLLDYFLIPPRYQFLPSQPEDILRLGLFFLVALCMSLLTSNFLESKQKIQQLGQQLAEENERKQAQGLLQAQFEQQRLVMEMSQRIRRSLDLQEILQTTVDEVRQFLGCDRVIIFKFFPGWGGTTVVESVAPAWMSILALEIYDPCIGEENIAPFKRGLVTARTDIYHADISPCHVEFLASLQVRANLVVPILLGDELWGLLTAHHCAAPREWEASQIALLRQLGEQVSIAIQQADLFAQVQTQLRERQQAQAALKESQIQLQRQLAEIETIYQSAPIGLNVLDADLRFVRINERLAEINGFSVEAHIGRTIRELLPDLADAAEQLLRRILATGEPVFNVEITGETPAQPGVQRTWLESFLPLKDGDCIIGISTVCEEITDVFDELRLRKRAEQALREREATLRLFAQYAPAAIAMFDRDMRYIMASQRWVDDYQLDAVESIIGRSHYEIFPEISAQWQQIHQRCLAGASEKCEEDLFVRLDGTQQWIRWAIHPWHNAMGEIGGIIIFGDDITIRKQAQVTLEQINVELEQRVTERTEALTEISDRLLQTVIQQQQTQMALLEQAQLLDLAHDTIMTCDFNAVITFWNEGAEYMYGWKKAEALGQVSHNLLKTQFSQPKEEIAAQLLQSGYWEGELTHIRRDGQSVTVASRWVLQTDPAGKPIKILEINNDITERKQAQAALQQYVREIEDLYNNAPCGYHSLDAEGNFIRINDTELQWLGYTRDEILHKQFLDILTFESRQVFLDSFPKFKQQGWVNNLEFEIVSKDKTTRWVSVNATAIKDADGNFLMSRSTVFDISEQQAALRDRKRNEAILRQYERIVSSTQDGIALLNRDYIYQIVNQAYLDWCNKSHTQVLGKSIRDVLGEDLFADFIQPRLDRCLAGETIHYERWFHYPNLVPQFMSVTYTPYREPDGSIWGIIVSQHDLTQLKQAEQMLEFQAVITRNMAEGVCLVRATDAMIVYANPKFEQMFGYESGELNGQNVSIVNYATDSLTAEDVNQSIRSAVLQYGEATYQVYNVKKDGTPFWCSATTSVFQHPDYGDVLVAVHQDITDRKRIEDALRQSEEKFRQLAENIDAVFWMKDIQQQQILYVSPAYESIWQRSCASLYQNALTWLDVIHPDDRSYIESASIEQNRSGQFDVKYRIIRPDGSMRWIRDRAFPIKNELGEMVRIAGIAEDITEQQKIEQIKNEFISIVSHELRTPLTSIRAALGLLNSGIYDKKPEKFKRMIEIAAIDSDRLVRLVNDILDLERLESGRAVLEKSTCKAADLIAQAVDGVIAIAKQQNITFNIHPTDAQVWAAADAIIQTLTNLLGNAIKFSPPNSTITLIVQQQTDYVLFQITDQGRGIPTDKLEAIFGRFQQVDGSDSRVKGGTGLGLAICRSIIDQHGGQIWAESTVDVGSTFFFTLPNGGDS
ncbi:PAS domain S-box protein [Anabaena azotica]|uniref:histidine kinase n=1 Tax=Anabaena azotica FACHB-119 TaxID=947527 RepID=A0ABR8D3I4_9NOST|nr:PAS domain S-box protein [Anabaena azotica]MBD2501462.1 PAS domain S-box protein [Anabaena azotica FACHB-119]